MTSSDDALVRGARELHGELDLVDGALAELFATRDVHEKLVHGAAAVAEDAASQVRGRFRTYLLALVLVACVWSPTVAYGAVALHQAVVVHCPSPLAPARDVPGAWYCAAFPYTHDRED